MDQVSRHHPRHLGQPLRHQQHLRDIPQFFLVTTGCTTFKPTIKAYRPSFLQTKWLLHKWSPALPSINPTSSGHNPPRTWVSLQAAPLSSVTIRVHISGGYTPPYLYFLYIKRLHSAFNLSLGGYTPPYFTFSTSSGYNPHFLGGCTPPHFSFSTPSGYNPHLVSLWVVTLPHTLLSLRQAATICI
ncbi:hypothetical protein BDN72DRAFT_903913 [Pluteus cervinus]|uniref:Uncharacterized protein n=1 Tax=Pluteus cervinus TaxID=181527 RepID=A0ACD3A7D9_9AGAR|nr:hypothetical protein BDN72DRAFT_903913 [Pluteus cervinus]